MNPTGLYQHYKGGFYRVLFVAQPFPTRSVVRGDEVQKILEAKLSDDHVSACIIYFDLVTEEIVSMSRDDRRPGESVVYVSLATGEIWVRPLKSAPGVDAWEDVVRWPDGVARRRFVPVEEVTRG